MAKPRKTLHLRKLVAWVNEQNATSTCQPGVREGWNALVISALMEADAYAGYAYLKADQLEGEALGKPPGIVFDDSGENRHTFPDATRVRFIVRKSL